MSNSTSNLDLISVAQAQKEVTANNLFNAASPAMLYGRRPQTSGGLVWGYFGGALMIAGTPTVITNGVITLTASATNYVEADPATGTVSKNTSGFTSGLTALYEVVVGTSTVTSYTDFRTGGGAAGVSDGDKGDITVSSSGATWTIDSSVISTFGRTLTDDADAAAARTTLGLAIGTNVQAYDADLAAIAGLTSAANKGIQFTGAGTAGTYDLTTAGKALLDDADAAAQRTTLGLGTAAILASDTDTSLAANSDTRFATQKAVKAYIDSVATSGATDVMIFRGVIDCSANPNYPAADAGNLYKVSVAGKIGGASGPNVEVGDTLYCIADATASGTHASVGASWNISQVNVDGAVIGPASATDNHLAVFDGTTGKLIKDGGAAPTGTNTGDETVTTAGALINGAAAKTTPVDADYVGLMDSAASNVLKKVSWAAVKATLKTYFDTLYGVVFAGGTLTSALNEAPAVTIASSSTPAIFAAGGNTINLTGTTTVTGFDTIAAGAVRRVIFSGILQLTYNATSMQNLTAANIATAAGDVAEFESLGSGNTKMLSYTRADGTALASAGGGGTSIAGTNGTTGGNATATGGTSSTSGNAGGGVIITGGTPGATGVGGVATVVGGAGGSTSGAGGAVSVTGGAATTSGNGGAVTVKGGAAASGSAVGGLVSILGGDGPTTGNGGDVLVRAGTGGSSATGGLTTVKGGNGLAAGGVAIQGGTPTNGTGGAVSLAGSAGVTSGAGGAVTISGGAAAGHTAGGAVTITAGSAPESVAGGAVTITAGSNNATVGYNINGSDVTITGGNGGATNTQGGNIKLTPGAGAGTGGRGNVILNGTGAALSTSAVGGFTCIPTCAGAPTGTPASIPTGTVPMVFDSTNFNLYVYVSGAWKKTSVFA